MLKKFKSIRLIMNAAAYVFLFSFSGVSSAEDVQNKILERINKSKEELLRLEKKIGKESRSLSGELTKKQKQIVALRSESASAQRLMDEQLLSLESLNRRVEKWQTQSNYQSHLLSAYFEEISLDRRALKVSPQMGEAALMSAAIESMSQRLNPRWSTTQLVSSEGKIIQSAVLNVGPIEIAYDEAISDGGPVMRSGSGEGQVLDIYTESQKSLLHDIYDKRSGYMYFDPSQGSAYKLMANGDGFFMHIKKGGVWAFPIIVFGILSFIISILKTIQFIRLPKIDTQLANKLSSVLQIKPSVESNGEGGVISKERVRSLIANTSSAQSRLINVMLTTPVSQYRDDLLVASLMHFKHQLEQYMGVVATSAAIAPLLGLLGTVSGMISTFKLMTIFGSGDASTVSGGISEALVTTELGLVVAIPSLIVSALLTRKTKSYNHNLEAFAVQISKIKVEQPK